MKNKNKNQCNTYILKGCENVDIKQTCHWQTTKIGQRLNIQFPYKPINTTCRDIFSGIKFLILIRAQNECSRTFTNNPKSATTQIPIDD